MGSFNARRYWWAVVVLAVVIGIAAAVSLDAYQGIGGFILFGLVGASFCWAYSIDQERLWWAIIPGLGALTLMTAMIVGTFVETNTESNWAAILVAGVGAYITGMVLRRIDAKVVLYVVSGFFIIIGIAYIPVVWVIKGVLIAAVVLAAVYLMWSNREALSSAGNK